MNNYCLNCGKNGHYSKKCNDPITSCGIICFNINNLKINKIESYLLNNYINIEDYNYKNLNYINKKKLYKNNIKFLMIQRKYSFSFIQFIRGKYDETNEIEIIKLFELMSIEEVNKIKNESFEILWNLLWLNTNTANHIQDKEFNLSFEKYKKYNYTDIKFKSKYDSTEWEFPKGRRNKQEKDIDCAKREFEEETNIFDYKLLNEIDVISDIFQGTDNKIYKHLYYLANRNNLINEHFEDSYEIADIGWFTIDEIIKKLRSYNINKINLINQIYFFLVIICEKLK